GGDRHWRAEVLGDDPLLSGLCVLTSGGPHGWDQSPIPDWLRRGLCSASAIWTRIQRKDTVRPAQGGESRAESNYEDHCVWRSFLVRRVVMPGRNVSEAGDRAIGVIRDFLRLESAGGILLMLAAAAALVLANTRADGLYQSLLGTPFEIRIGAFILAKPLVLWSNDGLMAVFFFLVGLEIKREVVEGELSSPAQVVLPAFAAAGGMATPAALYWWLNQSDPVAGHGWAIPAATDIAFALGILSLLGPRV